MAITNNSNYPTQTPAVPATGPFGGKTLEDFMAEQRKISDAKLVEQRAAEAKAVESRGTLQTSLESAQDPIAEMVKLFRQGGGYGAGQNAILDTAASQAQAKALSDQVVSGMSSGSLATSTGQRIASDTAKAKLGVEDTRTEFLNNALKELSGVRTKFAGLGSQERVSAEDRRSKERMQALGLRADKANLAAKILADAELQRNELTSAEFLKKLDITSQELMQQTGLTAQQFMQKAQITSAEKMNTESITAQKNMADMDALSRVVAARQPQQTYSQAMWNEPSSIPTTLFPANSSATYNNPEF